MDNDSENKSTSAAAAPARRRLVRVVALAARDNI